MAYTTSTLTRKRGFIRSIDSSGKVLEGECDSDVTITYSWRTGKKASAGFSGSQPYSPTKGNLAQSISDRRRLLEEVIDTVSTPDKPETKRYLLRDVGHEFATQRYQSFGSVFEERSWYSGGKRYTNQISGSGGALLGGLVSPLARSLPKYSVIQSVDGAPYYRSAWGLMPPVNLFTQNDLNSLFKSMAPVAPILPIGETLIELVRGQFPKVLANLGRLRGQISDLKHLGKEHLNMQFGWAPIFRDIQLVLETLMSLETLVYSSNDRRRRTLPERFEYVNTPPLRISGFSLPRMNPSGLNSTTVYPVVNGRTGVAFQSHPVHVSVRQDARISARFTNARPTHASNGFWDRAVELHYQLGFQDPALLWDLTSWSWLFDWWLNIGTSISNVNTFSKNSGVTPLDYAYMTRKTVVLAQRPGYVWNGTSSGSQPITSRGSISPMTEISTSLVRTRVTPFGPGVTLDSLSTYQWSILVALGLSRGR